MNTEDFSSKTIDDLQKEYRKLEKEKYDLLNSIKEKQNAITKQINDKKSEEDRKVLELFKKNITQLEYEISCVTYNYHMDYNEEKNRLYIHYSTTSEKTNDSISIMGNSSYNNIMIVMLIKYNSQIYLDDIMDVVEVIEDYIANCRKEAIG